MNGKPRRNWSLPSSRQCHRTPRWWISRSASSRHGNPARRARTTARSCLFSRPTANCASTPVMVSKACCRTHAASRSSRKSSLRCCAKGRREDAILRGTEAIIAATKGEYTGTGRTNLDGRQAGFSAAAIFILILFVIASYVQTAGKPGCHHHPRRLAPWRLGWRVVGAAAADSRAAVVGFPAAADAAAEVEPVADGDITA